MTPREELTKHLVNECNKRLPENEQVLLEDALSLWWVNKRKTGGYRLTLAGYNRLIAANLEKWNINIEKVSINSSLLLQLDKKLSSPYCLTNNKKLILFVNSKDAMLYNLYQDFDRWIKALPLRQLV